MKTMENYSVIISDRLKRKREANRIASADCKRRKEEKINKLKITVKNKKLENISLEQTQEMLNREIFFLEYELAKHVRSKYCPITLVGNKLVIKE